jgi:hypothetical protein
MPLVVAFDRDIQRCGERSVGYGFRHGNESVPVQCAEIIRVRRQLVGHGFCRRPRKIIEPYLLYLLGLPGFDTESLPVIDMTVALRRDSTMNPISTVAIRAAPERFFTAARSTFI